MRLTACISVTAKAVSGAAVAAMLLAACASPTDSADNPRVGPADAVGTVTAVTVGDGAVAVGFDPDAGYEYFEGTTFNVAVDGGLQNPDGTGQNPANLTVGDRIEVWVDACDESFPVQCGNPAARLLADR
jgi:hypothetical protein